ncbi:AAA family ATPase [Tellurirhabdus bombi]|uniref:AAA family ATPase n=1 Tax=Tellurirhabdus bombi TaxID=2907205 RepID=UPI001F2FA4DB|nr:AAA family ATPase [Tellurirhabdus bombi]
MTAQTTSAIANASNVVILNPKNYSTKEEYAVAMGYSKETGWVEICNALNLTLDPKGGRRTLYNAFKALNKDAAPAPKSVAVKVPVVDVPQPKQKVKPVEAPAPTVTEEVKPVEAAPVATEEVKPAEQPAIEEKPAEAAPVVVEVETAVVEPKNEVAPSVQEAAMMLSKALAAMNANVDPDQISKLVKEEFGKLNDQLIKKSEDTEKALLVAVEKLVNGRMDQLGVTRIEVTLNNAEPKAVTGQVHKEFENILRHAAIRDNVLLVGPAGSGKTTVCEQVAEALSLDFYCKSVCAQTSKAELLGYCDANGNYVTTEFRKAYENGGVFVLDEVDAGNPNVIAVLNSALSNSVCAFADQMVRKHADFILIACANTFGTGPDRQYVGRNQLDAATLDRFSVIEFGYDETLERNLAPNKWFCNFTQKLRKDLANERVVISPRATILGGKLIEAGFTPEYALKTRILKGMPTQMAERVVKVFGQFYNERSAKGLEIPNQAAA